jgi:hypothetical protein
MLAHGGGPRGNYLFSTTVSNWLPLDLLGLTCTTKMDKTVVFTGFQPFISIAWDKF